MDERRDPGEFYPGGRVIAREGVTPGQTIVNWSDIQGKPDFSDVAALGAADSLGKVKDTMNTVVNKMKTSMLILFAVGSALADIAPLYTTPNNMPGDAPIMTNTQEYVDAKVDSIPAADFTVSNDTLVATIEAKAPAPGNYAVVSNAAMNAVQPSVATNIAESTAASATNALDVSLSSRLSQESQNSTNYTDSAIAAATNNLASASSLMNYATRAELDAGWWSEWTLLRTKDDVTANVTAQVEQPEWETSEDGYWNVDVIDGDGEHGVGLIDAGSGKDATAIHWDCEAGAVYTATRHRVSAPVPTKPSDIGAQAALTFDTTPTANSTNPVTSGGIKTALDGKASTADATLTPIYSDTPTFSEWTFTGLPSGSVVTSFEPEDPGYEGTAWYLVATPHLEAYLYGEGGLYATSVSTPDTSITATRTRTDIIGYQLGNQSDKPLQPAGDYAQASVLADIAETATNALETAGAAAAASSTNSANIATLNAQVASIGAHLNAEDAHFVSTNYDSVVNLPEAYVEIKMRDEATGSNTWITIWQEMRRWTAFVGSAFDWQTWQGFHTWATNITQELSFKADRCWGIYDSETGGYSPEGYTQISSSNILIAAGMAYQRTVTSEGAVWILRCNQGVAQMGGDTNGFFQVFDGDGVVQFEIVKGDRREAGANADGITVDDSYSPVRLTIPYSIVADEHPTLQICDSLDTANWKAETDPDCLANVEWSGLSGAWVATVQRKTSGGSLFVKATYMAGGETYIRNAAPVSMDSIILNGVRYYLGTTTISGHTVLTLSTTAP